MMNIELDTRTININTAVSVVGFLATFVMIGIAWGMTQSTIRDLGEWRDAHATAHRDLQVDVASKDAVLEQQIAAVQSNIAKLDQAEYRITMNEKSIESMDTRISRVTENYSNQFADMRTQLSSISTQIALTNQTLQRMENTPRQPR